LFLGAIGGHFGFALHGRRLRASCCRRNISFVVVVFDGHDESCRIRALFFGSFTPLDASSAPAAFVFLT
jgi:hypothetical protein